MLRLLFLIIGLTGLLHAQTLQSGVRYNGPVKLDVEALSVSFQLPPDWHAELMTPQGPLSLRPEQGDAEILMEANGTLVANPLRLLDQHIAIYGLSLHSIAGIEQIRAALYRRHYLVADRLDYTEATCFLAVGSQQRGLLIRGFYNEALREPVRHALLAIATSVSFTPLRKLPGQRELQAALENAHLVFYEKVGPVSEKRELWLCRDRHAVMESVHSAMMHARRITLRQSGTWNFDPPMLTLEFDGMTRAFEVSRDDRELLIRGDRTFRLPNRLCDR